MYSPRISSIQTLWSSFKVTIYFVFPLRQVFKFVFFLRNAIKSVHTTAADAANSVFQSYYFSLIPISFTKFHMAGTLQEGLNLYSSTKLIGNTGWPGWMLTEPPQQDSCLKFNSPSESGSESQCKPSIARDVFLPICAGKREQEQLQYSNLIPRGGIPQAC